MPEENEGVGPSSAVFVGACSDLYQACVAEFLGDLLDMPNGEAEITGQAALGGACIAVLAGAAQKLHVERLGCR